MNRMSKAAVATGAAAVLLLGGAGTMAYWNDSDSDTGTSITSGSIDVAAVSPCTTWTFADADGGGAVALIVPGDSVVATCSFTVTGTGDHLGLSQLALTTPTFTDTTGELAAVLTPTLGSVTIDDTPVTVAADGTLDTPVALTSGTVYTVDVEVDVDFPYGATADNTTQLSTAELSAVTLTAQQAHCGPSATPACLTIA